MQRSNYGTYLRLSVYEQVLGIALAAASDDDLFCHRVDITHVLRDEMFHDKHEDRARIAHDLKNFLNGEAERRRCSRY